MIWELPTCYGLTCVRRVAKRECPFCVEWGRTVGVKSLIPVEKWLKAKNSGVTTAVSPNRSIRTNSETFFLNYQRRLTWEPEIGWRKTTITSCYFILFYLFFILHYCFFILFYWFFVLLGGFIGILFYFFIMFYLVYHFLCITENPGMAEMDNMEVEFSCRPGPALLT